MAETLPFLVVLAMGPLAVYLLALAIIHLSGKTFVITGERDWFALALALIGVVFVGPVELFFPGNGMVRFGWGVWFALLGLYGLPVLLIALHMRPQWVIYGADVNHICTALLQAAQEQDEGAVAHQEFVDLPTWGLRLKVDGTIGSASGRITAISNQVPLKQWRQLKIDLTKSLNASQTTEHEQVAKPFRTIGITYLIISLLMLGFLTVYVARDPAAMSRAFVLWVNH